MAKEQVASQGPAACPCRVPPGIRGALLCAEETEAARQPLLGVGRVQHHFCPLAVFPCGEDPCGAGQKEFRRELCACGEQPESCVGVRDAANSDAGAGPAWQGAPGTATATRRAGRELSLPGVADLGSEKRGMEGLSLERAAALRGLLFVEEELGLFPCPRR